ncbi:MAG: HEAT repeat domain-containing protein [Chloroflexi bacterium]|nr:HEAT repeat domain-containing protein [Chloroflexota bacterium]
MNFLQSFFDPALRFERAFADHLARRYRYILWPLARVDLTRDWIEPRGLQAALAQNDRLVITGVAGMGKTTTLAYLALANGQAILDGDPLATIPLFFNARDLVGNLPRIPDLPRGLNLGDALTVKCPRIFFANVFNAGRAVVLIDDADALTAEQLQAWLKDFTNVRVIATARAPLPGWAEYRLPGFSDGDIATLAQKTLGTDAFLAALKGVPRALTTNPMILTMLTRIWREGEPLPTRRAAIFDEYVRVILGDQDETAKMFEALALAIQRGKPASNEFLSKSRGLLRTAKNRTAEFVHELWQAYFAARALRLTPDLAAILAHLQDPSWEETLLFYAGLGDADNLADAVRSRGDLYFTGRILAHARAARADLRDAVTDELTRLAWQGDPRAIASLSEMNSEVAVDGYAAKLKDKDPAVRTRAAQVLGLLQLDRGIEYLLPQLRDVNADVRDKVVEALGRARTDRVIEPLLVALRGDPRVGQIDTRLRVAAAKALGEIGSDRAAPALIVDLQVGEPEVRAVAAEALKRITSPLMLEPLRGIAQSGDAEARRYASEILAIVNGKS